MFKRMLLLMALAPGGGLSSAEPPATQPAAVTPAPADEQWWQDTHHFFANRTQEERIDLLFIGDQVAEGFMTSACRGWREELRPSHAADFGIPTDTTENVLWRVRHGEVDSPTVKTIVLSAGNTNVLSEPADRVAEGVAAVVAAVREEKPGVKIIVLSVTGRADLAVPADLPAKLAAVNAKLAKLDDGKSVRFLQLAAGTTRPHHGTTRVTPARVSGRAAAKKIPTFTAQSYEAWYTQLRPLLADVLDAGTQTRPAN